MGYAVVTDPFPCFVTSVAEKNVTNWKDLILADDSEDKKTLE